MNSSTERHCTFSSWKVNDGLLKDFGPIVCYGLLPESLRWVAERLWANSLGTVSSKSTYAFMNSSPKRLRTFSSCKGEFHSCRRENKQLNDFGIQLKDDDFSSYIRHGTFSSCKVNDGFLKDFREIFRGCFRHPYLRSQPPSSSSAGTSRPSSLLTTGLLILAMQWTDGGAFPTVPLSSLFTNAVLRAQHLHQLATNIYKEFERSYIPEEQRYSMKNSQTVYCYSDTIPSPTRKEETQQKTDMELLRFSRILIQSWLNPVRFLSRMFTNSLVIGASDRVYEKLQDLEQGIQVLMREVQDGTSQSLQLVRPTYEKFELNLRSEVALLKNYNLLSCFKKDLHKVETFLRVMKCRRFREISCVP
ncbi:somatotropin-like [Ahaetulla prasina]|uniref:somatotropin-like n=1 Tax=Ahaetulla prasina TaxID=499056 RepID=UPI002647E2C1|nr:somatotropin-like [Ahaetulla prasina]